MQRYSIFSKYDDGIKLTDDAWFEVTPEPVAIKIAEHISKATPAHKKVLIDAFGGCGGNVIQFALSGRWDRIFAVEKDPEKVKCARHNSEIYGVGKKIFWITGDVFEALRKRLKSLGKEAVIFASPPWGGQSYRDAEVFDLETMTPYWLEQMYSSFSKVSKDIVLYLPRTSDLNQIAKYVPDGEKVQVTHYCMDGASKVSSLFDGRRCDRHSSQCSRPCASIMATLRRLR